jgi:colanic acid biosynthesis protein WcaH
LLSSGLYKKIVESIPITSVEAIILKDDSFLLMKRNNEPVKDCWWFPGGRIRKNETFQEALHREIKEETGLKLTESRLLNIYERIFPERHDITIAYLCKCKGKIKLNNEHSQHKYYKKPPKNTHPYIQQVINDLRNQNLLPNSTKQDSS